MNTPGDDGYKHLIGEFRFRGIPERTLEMLKVAACLVLATWMAACLMTIVYSHEIAVFIRDRSHAERSQ